MPNNTLKLLVPALLVLTACTGVSNDADSRAQDSLKMGEDIQVALAGLQSAEVLDVGAAAVPTFIRGELGRTTVQSFAAADAPAALAPHLALIAPVFRLDANDLQLKSVATDDLGYTHVRYQQTKNGLKVVGGELILHVNAQGILYAANGEARDGVSLSNLPAVSPQTAQAVARAAEGTVTGASAGEPRLVYFRSTADGSLALAWELTVSGMRAGAQARDLVYVNAQNGKLLEAVPQIHDALNRAVYSANNGTSLPGTLRRSEGGAATGDTHIDMNYDQLGVTYNCYSTLFGRNSYNNAGAQLKSSVHYSTNYVNAYWDGTQMVYGDGDGVQSLPLGKDLDVTVHELSHAVTENESNLTYSYESGALNEAFSDVAAAFCESWSRLGMGVDGDVWKIGEDIWTPGTPGDALRYMDNPTIDGSSKDYYPERYTGSSDNGGVHWNSGIFNLYFKLLVTGGTHPRGKTTTNVTGVGMSQAAQIVYRANANYWTASTNFASAKTGCAQAATDLYGAAATQSSNDAFTAVGVGGGGGGGVTTLTNGVPVTNQSGSTGAQANYKITVPSGQTSLTVQISGGTGDADLYVNFGTQPTLTTYQCRPYLGGNAETCTFSNPAAGDWYIMLNAYATYSGVSLVATYSGGGGDPYLTNGTPVTNISGASGSAKYWRLAVPSGKTQVVFTISGGTGDADMYVRSGARPTTSTYNCRPYLSGNNETCTISNPAAGDWYVMLRGYSAYSGVSLKGQY